MEEVNCVRVDETNFHGHSFRMASTEEFSVMVQILLLFNRDVSTGAIFDSHRTIAVEYSTMIETYGSSICDTHFIYQIVKLSINNDGINRP